MPPAGAPYGAMPPGGGMYGAAPPPAQQQPTTYVVQGGFDAGARFDGISKPNIPVSFLFLCHIILITIFDGYMPFSGSLPTIIYI